MIIKLINHTPYSNTQADYLKEIGGDIKRRISSHFKNGDSNQIRGNVIKSYGYIALWILGSYEFARTLKSNEKFFEENEFLCIKEFHDKMKTLRIPLSKQEYKNDGGICNQDQFINSFDKERKDFLFKVKDEIFYYKEIYQNFLDMLEKIAREVTV